MIILIEERDNQILVRVMGNPKAIKYKGHYVSLTSNLKWHINAIQKFIFFREQFQKEVQSRIILPEHNKQ